LYEVFIHPKADKQLEKLPEKDRIRIEEKLRLLSEFPRVKDIVKIQGRKSCYRLRVGKYRILFEVFKDKEIIVIAKIDVRGRIYKNLD